MLIYLLAFVGGADDLVLPTILVRPRADQPFRRSSLPLLV